MKTQSITIVVPTEEIPYVLRNVSSWHNETSIEKHLIGYVRRTAASQRNLEAEKAIEEIAHDNGLLSYDLESVVLEKFINEYQNGESFLNKPGFEMVEK